MQFTFGGIIPATHGIVESKLVVLAVVVGRDVCREIVGEALIVAFVSVCEAYGCYLASYRLRRSMLAEGIFHFLPFGVFRVGQVGIKAVRDVSDMDNGVSVYRNRNVFYRVCGLVEPARLLVNGIKVALIAAFEGIENHFCFFRSDVLFVVVTA